MISKIVGGITPSATCELEGLIGSMKKEGIDVVALNIGEPDYKTPENICQACKDAIDERKTTYVATAGVPELRQAICRKLQRDNGLTYAPEQICVSTGAKQALFNAVMAVPNPGDEVIIPTPGWVSYVEMVKLVGGIPVCVPCKDDFQLDVAAIRAAVTDKTAAIIINSPNNPTGAIYTLESLQAMADLAVEKDIYIIADEIYEKLAYGGCKHYSVAALSPEAYEHTIVINGMSKAYRMTGWRCGYTAAPRHLAGGINSLQGHMTSNSTTFVQWAAIEALDNGEPEVQQMVEEFVRRRDYAYDRVSKMAHVSCTKPDGAFYLMPDVSWYFGKKAGDRVIKDSFDMSEYLLQQYHVAVVPGGAFMSPGTLRIAYTNSMEEIKRGLDRIEEALAALKD